ncbi:spliceosome RNA helicase Bat1, putative [Entamoeba dispar SAW760]|uniref:RNA helicase n=1 Tax=Entamoeba dispar (strain ATCC PRA-260 / SAW760) TaxID=370354 RepID=B0EJF6_ENTDS|nr:spliceosome RNA helicase Bat1, putative [Entamoeba dispar SAW760]XP_001740939.1 spliceosome RNA helicase Bat1, putative [Entamoeba dispar SAW760]EDR22621.1 spliceosome RNA helicase Bat1, putative [Entamoeba dispar SAW760]EDR25351.1 spliceosome RNA helicase Bat1, putative [Entamoeba dispar SAW760]|eukprot:EDR22621.1 spliceosome RNA helicase Bat1, putative [Entamoeba dispar SAW760]
MTDPTNQIPDYVPTTETKMDIEPANKDNYVGTVAFSNMNLKKEILMAITDCGFEHPSEVQSQVIPKALLKQDILCQAKSGMGKTAVFVISILNQGLCLGDYVSALVICHTRELALQAQKEFDRMKKRLCEATGKEIPTGTFVGGVEEKKDIEFIKTHKPTIVIGTPGRIASLVRQKALDLSKLDTFVIDECDKVLGSTSEIEIGEIFISSPKEKQVMMFSATISETNKGICRKYLKNQLEVFIDDGEKLFLHGLHLYFKKLGDNDKKKTFMDIIDYIDFNQAIVFAENSERCRVLVKKLKQIGYPCGILYGRMDQEIREKEYQRFRDGESRVLVSTDLCGRGIDVAKVNLVVNFDMPNDSDQFLHRVGRAGRFGTKGVAISFIDTEEDDKVLKEVQSRFAVQMDELPSSLKDIPTSYYK